MVGTLSTLLHDAVVTLGVAAAMLAGLVLVNVGLLLPGLLTWLNGRHGGKFGRRLKPGPGNSWVVTKLDRPEGSWVPDGGRNAVVACTETYPS